MHKAHICALGELCDASRVVVFSVHTRAHAVHIEYAELEARYTFESADGLRKENQIHLVPHQLGNFGWVAWPKADIAFDAVRKSSCRINFLNAH